LNPDPKAQAPFASPVPLPARAPLTKRDTPKTTDQTNKAPLTNTKKDATAPNPTSGIVKPSNNRPSRDTQQKPQDSYKPQASGVPQKTNVPSPSRDTPPRAQTNNNNDQKPTVVTPQKNTASDQKPQQNSRNRRDTVKQTDNQKPVEWNKDNNNKNKAPQPQQPASTLNADRKTRETPKTNTNEKPKAPVPAPASTDKNRKTRETPKSDDKAKVPVPAPSNDKRKTRETPKTTQTKDDKAKASIPTQPDVAKVPLTSTNSRNRRDAPNPTEQSKLVPSGTINGKIENPSLQARKDTTTAAPLGHKRDTEKQGIRYPVPVDQVIKQKNTDDKPVADNSKPVENVNKKV
jgi:hypothetical protein